MIAAMLYVAFFWVLVFEAAIFLLLNAPTPRGFKGALLNFLSNNKIITYVMYLHLGFCIIALFFYFDLMNQQSFFTAEKQRIRNSADHHLGSELRISFYSYTILKIQRNKYITFMLIYTSIALNLFVQLLKYIYRKRAHLESLGLLPKVTRKDSDKLAPHESENRNSQQKQKAN